ncbi:CLUMA_CG006150, isoform A [Clunio marinus]|uniref:CLUMA_CG006150, isoform A n=1 Tax=Clunio marinus TaxID=568069 RepID=A0A1J1HX89_9DIPT|nr:CLUMA_CG006150, isoform A [Clunio marinus]
MMNVCCQIFINFLLQHEKPLQLQLDCHRYPDDHKLKQTSKYHAFENRFSNVTIECKCQHDHQTRNISTATKKNEKLHSIGAYTQQKSDKKIY